MEKTQTTCSVAFLATLYNLSERRVHQLVQEGVFVRIGHGCYDTIASIRGYTQYLKSLTELDEDALKRERQRLIKAQADRTEQGNQKEAENLMDIALISDLLQEVAVRYAACVDALPGKCAHELTNIEDPALIKAKLFAECRVLRQVSAQRLYEFAHFLDRAEALREKIRRPACQDTRPVGG